MRTLRILRRFWFFLCWYLTHNGRLARRLLDTTIYRASKDGLQGDKFYLTGSRYFRNARLKSDYDLFIEATHQAGETLKDLGFRQLHPSLTRDLRHQYVGDPNIADVYEKGKVQVQLVLDAAHKLRAQEYLLLWEDPYFFEDLKSRDKILIRRWWQHAYHETAETPEQRQLWR